MSSKFDLVNDSRVFKERLNYHKQSQHKNNVHLKRWYCQEKEQGCLWRKGFNIVKIS